LAFIYIKNFKSNDETQYKWHWQTENVEKMKKHLENDEIQLKAFTKDSSKIKDKYLHLLLLNIFIYIKRSIKKSMRKIIFKKIIYVNIMLKKK